MVKYVPHNDDVVYAPGLDGHDGGLPKIGDHIPRDFRVVFGIHGVELPLEITYNDVDVDTQWWCLQTGSGFHDNRLAGGNHDYVIALEDLKLGLLGGELLGLRIS